MMCFLDTFLTEKYIFVLLVFFYLIFLLVFVTLSKTNALLPVIACGFIRNVYKGARITKRDVRWWLRRGLFLLF